MTDEPKPIIIRGRRYKSPESVAKKFGVSVRYVKVCIRLGRTDRIGRPPHITRVIHGAEPFRVRIRGKIYASVKEASVKLCVSEDTIRGMLRRGREDFIGLGRSRAHRKRRPGPAPNASPVHVGPYVWPSITVCARSLRVGKTTLRRHIQLGDMTWLMARALDVEARSRNEAIKLREAA